jgi:hypothetical protein
MKNFTKRVHSLAYRTPRWFSGASQLNISGSLPKQKTNILAWAKTHGFLRGIKAARDSFSSKKNLDFSLSKKSNKDDKTC